MNVKSKFDTEEEYTPKRDEEFMRGMCGNSMNMIAEATRVDASEVRAPNFMRRIFQALGWKTQADPQKEE